MLHPDGSDYSCAGSLYTAAERQIVDYKMFSSVAKYWVEECKFTASAVSILGRDRTSDYYSLRISQAHTGKISISPGNIVRIVNDMRR